MSAALAPVHAQVGILIASLGGAGLGYMLWTRTGMPRPAQPGSGSVERRTLEYVVVGAGLLGSGVLILNATFPTAVIALAVAVVGAASIAHLRWTGAWPVAALATVSGLLLAWAGMAALLSAYRHLSFSRWLEMAGGAVLALTLASRLSTATRLRVADWGASGLAVAVALLATLRVRLPTGIAASFYLSLPDLLSRTSNINVAGSGLAMLSLFPLAAAWLGRQRAARAMHLVLLLACAAVLAAGQSRVGFLSLAAGVTALAWAGLARHRRLVALAAAVLWLAALAGASLVLDPLNDTPAPEAVAARAAARDAGLLMVSDHPFTGIGLGAFPHVAALRYQPLAGQVDHAHNMWIQVALDLGTPGLVLWMALNSLAALAALSSLRDSRQHRLAARLGAACLAALAAYWASGLFDVVLWDSKPEAAAWAVWGLAVACGTADGLAD
jgi:O-antigen ligase